MRIVMKISGEALKDEKNNISEEMLNKVCCEIEKIVKGKHQLILVLGGGNFFRGRDYSLVDDSIAGSVGMLGTIMNALALTNFLNNKGIKCVCYSAFDIPGIVDRFDYSKVISDLKDSVIVLGGGLGVPYFSTDMVTVVKAVELKADIIFMAKNVDGIYDKDPKLGNAKKYEKITHEELMKMQMENGIDKLSVIDFEAIGMLCKNKIPLYLYSAKDLAIEKFFNNEYVGTLVIS